MTRRTPTFGSLRQRVKATRDEISRKRGRRTVRTGDAAHSSAEKSVEVRLGSILSELEERLLGEERSGRSRPSVTLTASVLAFTCATEDRRRGSWE